MMAYEQFIGNRAGGDNSLDNLIMGISSKPISFDR